MNHRQDQLSGGKESIALALKAASVTTKAGNSTKAIMTLTAAAPRTRRTFWGKSWCDAGRRQRKGSRKHGGMSMQANSFERPCRRAHQRKHDEGKDEASDRKACRKRE